MRVKNRYSNNYWERSNILDLTTRAISIFFMGICERINIFWSEIVLICRKNLQTGRCHQWNGDSHLPQVAGNEFQDWIGNPVGQPFCSNCSVRTWPNQSGVIWHSEKNIVECPRIATHMLSVAWRSRFLSRDSRGHDLPLSQT